VGLPDKIHITQTTLVEPCPSIRHQSFKRPKTHQRAHPQLGLGHRHALRHHPGDTYGAREGRGRIVIKQSNAAQNSKNQIPLWIPISHPTPKLNQNHQNPGKLPGDVERWGSTSNSGNNGKIHHGCAERWAYTSWSVKRARSRQPLSLAACGCVLLPGLHGLPQDNFTSPLKLTAFRCPCPCSCPCYPCYPCWPPCLPA
jgi:hypothetical protein